MAKIELKNVAHSYTPSVEEPEYALKKCNLIWKDGGRYAVLGPSGCGKTTMLNIMSGLVKPSEGSLNFDESGFEMSRGYIRGEISCDEGSPIVIDHEFFITRNRPIITSFSSDIPLTESTKIRIPLSFEGSGSQSWIVGIDGPVARITTTTQIQNLGNGDELVIEVEPDNLLTPGMIARGHVILATESGHRWELDITLTAQKEDMTAFDEWRQPERVLPIACILAAIWFLLGIKTSETTRQPASEFEEGPSPHITIDSTNPSFANSLGEPDTETDTLPVGTSFVDHLQ